MHTTKNGRSRDPQDYKGAILIGAMSALIFAAMIIVGAHGAKAADLGGNCCADLEERVAELEATVAKKGNRKVSLTVTGTVNEALLFAAQGSETAHAFGSNVIDPTRFGFTGRAKINNHISAGYNLEVGLGVGNDELVIRESHLFVDTPAGRVSLGRTTTATKDIGALSTANTVVASKMLSALPFVDDLAFNGGRANLIKYDSPAYLGFVASASWQSAGSWDAALRWSGGALGFNAAAGVGYAYTSVAGVDVETVSGSVSVMHVESGLFVNAAAGTLDPRHFDANAATWQVQGGIERKLVDHGATTVFAEYGQGKATVSIDAFTASADTLRFYGAGVVQRVDSAALDLYVSWRRYDAETPIDAVLAGARIQF